MDNHGFVANRRDLAGVNTASPGDLLTEEFPVNIPNQNYALLSYLGPATQPSGSWFGLRIYGTFASVEEANRAADKARQRGYNHWDLFVVDIHHGFFPMPPPCDSSIADVQYTSDVLTKLMRRDQDEVKESNDRVTQRAEEEVEVKSSTELLTEMAESAVAVCNQSSEASKEGLIDALVERFRSISGFV